MNRRSARAAALVALALVILSGLVKAAAEGYAGYHVRAAEQVLRRQDYVGARHHLGLALKARPSSPVLHLLLGRVCRQAGEHAAAEEHLKQCRRLQGGQSEDYQLEVLMLQAQQGQMEEVFDKLYVYVDQGRPEAPLVLEALCQAALSQQLTGAAAAHARRWLDLEPDNVQALYCLGWCLLDRGLPEEAVDCLGRAHELAPDRTDVRQALAAALAATHHDDEAVAHYVYCLRADPNDPTALLGAARCWFDLGKPEEARRLLDAALERGDGDARLMAERGKLALHVGRPEEAEGWLRKALAADPNEMLAPYQLPICLRQLGRTSEAERLAEENRKRDADLDRLQHILTVELRTSPRSPALFHELGSLMVRNGRPQGLLWLYKALKLDPDYRPTHAFLADYWQRQGVPEKAAEHRARLAEE